MSFASYESFGSNKSSYGLTLLTNMQIQFHKEILKSKCPIYAIKKTNSQNPTLYTEYVVGHRVELSSGHIYSVV